MKLTFSKWLRTSNEAKPFRDAFELTDQMPTDYRLKANTFELVRHAAEAQWLCTKFDLDGAA